MHNNVNNLIKADGLEKTKQLRRFGRERLAGLKVTAQCKQPKEIKALTTECALLSVDQFNQLLWLRTKPEVDARDIVKWLLSAPTPEFRDAFNHLSVQQRQKLATYQPQVLRDDIAKAWPKTTRMKNATTLAIGIAATSAFVAENCITRQLGMSTSEGLAFSTLTFFVFTPLGDALKQTFSEMIGGPTDTEIKNKLSRLCFSNDPKKQRKLQQAPHTLQPIERNLIAHLGASKLEDFLTGTHLDRQTILTSNPPPRAGWLQVAWQTGFRQNIMDKLKNRKKLADRFVKNFDQRLAMRKLLES